MGLNSLPDPRMVFRRKEDQKEKIYVDGRPPNVIARLIGFDRLPPQQPLHREHKGFSEIYRQWTALVSSQRDGKPYEHRSNRKDSMARQECKDEYEVLETSKVERSSYPAKRTINSKLSEAEMAFIQQKFMADHDRILSKLGEGLRVEKYFKRSARLDWLEGASSKESTRAAWKLPRLQSRLMVSSQRDGKPYEHRSNRKDSMAWQECKDEYEVLETSKVESSSYPAKRTINSKLFEAEIAFIQQKFMADHGTFEQVLECLDNENLEHLAMMKRLLGSLPQHMIISANLRAEKYFKRSARLDWLEGASSKESTRAVWKLPRLQYLKLGHLKKRRFSCSVQYLNHNLQQAQKRLIIRCEIFGGIYLSSDSNDGEILMESLGKCCSCSSHGQMKACHGSEQGQNSVPNLLSTINGPWALIYWHVTLSGNSRTIWFGRDAFGRRSLLVHWPTSRLLLTSVLPPHSIDKSSGI
ncbi:unnamed protein product [Camellia sinensis]